MPTNFPTSLDSLTNPTDPQTLADVPHDGQHTNANDAIEAIEAKVGVDASAVTTSLDFKVAQTISKQLVDAKGDLIVATAADTVARVAVGSNDQVLVADSAQASGVKWAATPGILTPSAEINLLAEPFSKTGTWVRAISAVQYFNGWHSNSSALQNEEGVWRVALQPGTYQLTFFYVKFSTAPIITITVDGQTVGTVDAYAAGLAGALIVFTGFVLTGAYATRDVKFQATSKNASSTGYQMNLTWLSFQKTA